MRYKLEVRDGQLVLEVVDDDNFPLRAHGFLQFSAKEHKNAELMLEIRGKDVLMWVQEKKYERKP